MAKKNNQGIFYVKKTKIKRPKDTQNDQTKETIKNLKRTRKLNKPFGICMPIMANHQLVDLIKHLRNENLRLEKTR